MRRELRAVTVTRCSPTGRAEAQDVVATEEPLELRVQGETLAVTMRTPGHDRQLALGFLYAEGVLRSLDEVGTLAHCGRTGDEGRENTLEVTPAPGAKLVLPEEGGLRRGTLTTSACGVCGRRSIEDLLARCAPVQSDAEVSATALLRAARALRERQPLFAQTGGCHGAGLATLEGELGEVFEDVGRHNAVDKLVGSLLLAGRLPASRGVLVVSGRTSFEIVQKAVAAGIPVVAGISAASSLAVETARRCGVTLAGFVRGEELVVYAGEARVRG